AHRGVLFLDEFPEFPRGVIENLRQPLEDGFVTVARVRGAIRFPAKFMLVAAMNPCPCGWYGSKEKTCSCRSTQILQYGKKISGPIMDRIDIVVTVPKVSYEKLSRAAETPSETVREKVKETRGIQYTRFEDNFEKRIFTNAEMSLRDLKKFCALTSVLDRMLEHAMHTLGVTPRGIHRLMKVSRTIADLDHSNEIKETHLAEALQYRDISE
ncbi:MAG: ATP-binding protein, partial [Parcubacteria group bacterium]|nr:ATP-binding protein [Parcubacteria group bacterium]